MSPATRAAARPERWSAEAGGERDVVRLEIPADAQRERRFEVSVRLVVRQRGGRSGATHALRVHVDGMLEWSRRDPTPLDGDDALEVRLVRELPIGRPLKLVGASQLAGGSERVALTIVAEEL